jgi:hypothetical protein
LFELVVAVTLRISILQLGLRDFVAESLKLFYCDFNCNCRLQFTLGEFFYGEFDMLKNKEY